MKPDPAHRLWRELFALEAYRPRTLQEARACVAQLQDTLRRYREELPALDGLDREACSTALQEIPGLIADLQEQVRQLEAERPRRLCDLSRLGTEKAEPYRCGWSLNSCVLCGTANPVLSAKRPKLCAGCGKPLRCVEADDPRAWRVFLMGSRRR